jgi:acetylornithine deacetylase
MPPPSRPASVLFLQQGLEHEFGLHTGKGIAHQQLLEVPPLHTNPRCAAVLQLQTLLGDTEPISVPFGSEAGFFSQVGWPAVVCGPGDIAQAHQPNEFIPIGQLERCAQVLHSLGQTACDLATPTKDPHGGSHLA